MSDAYPAGQVRRVLRLSQRRLDYWAELGIVKPSVRAARGKGSERLYSFEDLVKLSVVLRLRQTGLSLQRIRKSLEKLARGPKVLATEVLVTDGKTLFRRIKSGEALEEILSGQLVMSAVAVGRIRSDLKESLAPLPSARLHRLRTVSG